MKLAEKHKIRFYRYGGEEFIVCFPIKEKEIIMQICEEIRMTIEKLAIMRVEHPQQVVTVSIGFAILEDMVERKYERLITLADKALYDVKENGRNQVKMYEKSL